MPRRAIRRVVAGQKEKVAMLIMFPLDGKHIRRRTRGQGLVEYALIIALVAVVVIAAMSLLGSNISSVFNHISASL